MTKPIYILNGPNLNLLGQTGKKGAGLVINPAAYTHSSVAIHDALKGIEVPSIEVHLSQPAKRESFRQRSFVSEAVVGTISGFGANSYNLGLQALINLLKN